MAQMVWLSLSMPGLVIPAGIGHKLLPLTPFSNAFGPRKKAIARNRAVA